MPFPEYNTEYEPERSDKKSSEHVAYIVNTKVYAAEADQENEEYSERNDEVFLPSVGNAADEIIGQEPEESHGNGRMPARE